jgi:hypothetical protein
MIGLITNGERILTMQSGFNAAQNTAMMVGVRINTHQNDAGPV